MLSREAAQAASLGQSGINGLIRTAGDARVTLVTRRTRRWLILLIVLFVVVGGWIARLESRHPPLERLRHAMASVAEVRKSGAKSLAPQLLKQAEDCLSLGQREIERVNQHWWPFVSYRSADSLLLESVQLAKLAENEAQNKRTGKIKSVKGELVALSDSLASWRDILDYSLPQVDLELLYRSARFSLDMAHSLFDSGQTESAKKYAENTQVTLKRLQMKFDSQQLSVSRRREKSKVWIDQTLAESKSSGKPALVVDKSKHLLYVVRAGVVKDSINCELGFNSGHQKQVAGDGATPEGMYRVVHINNSSKYYRALLLNYPNEADKKRFSTNLEAGSIPPGSKIGGLIEIHGKGGQGKDWTDGCVAVTDKRMDQVIKIAPVGTSVTIVHAWEGRR